MALDNNTQITDRNTINNWFKTGLKPSQQQFWSTVVNTLINIPRFEINSQHGLKQLPKLIGCKYFDKYTKI